LPIWVIVRAHKIRGISVSSPQPSPSPSESPAESAAAVETAPATEAAAAAESLNTEISSELMALVNEAREHFVKGNFVKAEELYVKFLESQPDNVIALANLGVAQFRQGKLTAAQLASPPSLEFGTKAFDQLFRKESSGGCSQMSVSTWNMPPIPRKSLGRARSFGVGHDLFESSSQ
jgi:tetratricopeptide (TPR) repeat protein